jgi:GNAT superfamily N-acetyltransferase
VRGETSYELRRYVEADAPAVDRFLRRQWQREDLAEHVRWKAGKGPDGESSTWLAVHRDSGEVLGTYFIVARTLVFAGNTIRYGLPTDNVIVPEYRGRGVWPRLVETARDAAFRSGMTFLLGCPNSAALPPNLRLGMNTPVFRLPTYYRRLSWFASRRRVRSAYVRPHRWLEELDTLPTDYGLLWEELERERLLTPRKSGEFLRWRYAPPASPGNPTHWFAVREGGSLRALATVVGRGHTAHLSEFLLSRNGPELAHWLAETLTDRLRRSGYRHLVFHGVDEGLFAWAFRDYKRVPEKNPLVTVTLPLEHRALLPYLRCCRAVFTAGDFDFL